MKGATVSHGMVWYGMVWYGHMWYCFGDVVLPRAVAMDGNNKYWRYLRFEEIANRYLSLSSSSSFDTKHVHIYILSLTSLLILLL